jgi:hypothetical protein
MDLVWPAEGSTSVFSQQILDARIRRERRSLPYSGISRGARNNDPLWREKKMPCHPGASVYFVERSEACPRFLELPQHQMRP